MTFTKISYAEHPDRYDHYLDVENTAQAEMSLELSHRSQSSHLQSRLQRL